MLRHVQLFVTPLTVAPSGTSVRGILQAIILEWVAISSSGDHHDPGIKPGSPALQADSLPIEPPGKHLLYSETSNKNRKHVTWYFNIHYPIPHMKAEVKMIY